MKKNSLQIRMTIAFVCRVDHSNLRPVLLQTPNTSHSCRFHKSRISLFRRSTHKVRLFSHKVRLTKTFACFLSYFSIENSVCTSNLATSYRVCYNFKTNSVVHLEYGTTPRFLSHVTSIRYQRRKDLLTTLS